MLRPSANAAQVVVGGIADGLAMDMRAVVEAGTVAPIADGSATYTLPDRFVAAAGRATNIVAASHPHGRLRIEVHDSAQVDVAAFDRLGAHALIWPQPDIVHALIG